MRLCLIVVLAAAVLLSGSPPLGAGELSRKDVIFLINQEKNFTGVDLSYLDLSGLDLSGATFYGCNLYRTSFAGSLLQYADFTGANIEDADLTEAQLWGANFKDALNLSKACFKGARFNPKTTLFPPGFSPIPYGAFIAR